MFKLRIFSTSLTSNRSLFRLKSRFYYTPRVLEQWKILKKEYPDYILCFKYGSFFEFYKEDAIIVSKVLQYKIGKHGRTGFPDYALETNITKLVNNGYKLAITEQFENEEYKGSKNRKLVNRKVVKLLSPGTHIDDTIPLLKHKFLLCINNKYKINDTLKSLINNTTALKSLPNYTTNKKDEYGLSWIDINTGQVFISQCHKNCLYDTINQIEPCEIIINSDDSIDLSGIDSNILVSKINYSVDGNNLVSTQDLKYYYQLFTKYDKIFGCKLHISTLYLILNYVLNSNYNIEIISILYEEINNKLSMNNNTIKTLELIKALNDSSNHLFNCLNNTSTPAGSRLLKHRLLNPYVKVEYINKSLDMIDYFMINNNGRVLFAKYAKKIGDLETYYQNILNKNSELILFANNLFKLNKLKNILIMQHKTYFNDRKSLILKEINELMTDDIKKWYNITLLYNKINPLNHMKIMKNTSDINAIISDYKNKLPKGKKQIIPKDLINTYMSYLNTLIISSKSDQLLDSLKINTNIPYFKLIDTKDLHGYCFELLGSKYDDTTYSSIKSFCKKYNLILVQELKSKYRFKTNELIKLEEKNKKLYLKLQDLNLKIKKKLTNKLRLLSNKFNTIFKRYQEYDLYTSYAQLSIDRNYIRPNVMEKKSDENILEVKEGRHPVIEQQLIKNKIESNTGSQNFVSNDVLFDNKNRFLLITGANMSGKSTYLRMIGLLCIMSQCGLYIPCKQLNMTIIDNICSRVGSIDLISLNLSSFKLEINELNNILNNSTNNSLILLDEIGRTTNNIDGNNLSYAIIKYIYKYINCRTLFSTHYYNLYKLENKLKYLKNLYANVIKDEKNNTLIFTHKIKYGYFNQRYALDIAKMANLPAKVIQYANEENKCIYEDEKKMTV